MNKSSEKNTPKASESEDKRTIQEAGADLLADAVKDISPELFQLVTDLATGFQTQAPPTQAMAEWASWVATHSYKAQELMERILRTLPQAALLALRDEQWIQRCRGLSASPPPTVQPPTVPPLMSNEPMDAKQNFLKNTSPKFPHDGQ